MKVESWSNWFRFFIVNFVYAIVFWYSSVYVFWVTGFRLWARIDVSRLLRRSFSFLSCANFFRLDDFVSLVVRTICRGLS